MSTAPSQGYRKHIRLAAAAYLSCAGRRVGHGACGRRRGVDEGGHAVRRQEEHVLACSLDDDGIQVGAMVPASNEPVVVVGYNLAGEAAERALRHSGGGAARHGEDILKHKISSNDST